MRFLALCLLLALGCTHADARAQSTLEQQAEQAKLQQMQREIETARIEAQTENMRMRAELLRLQIERQDAERAKPPEPSFFDRMDEYRAKKAADQAVAKAVADREEIAAMEANMAAARSANRIYLGLAVALPVAFGFLITKRTKAAGGMMEYEQKFGMMLMVGSLLLCLFALSISEDWRVQMDMVQNLMLSLKIRLFADSESPSGFVVDVYTKHVLLGPVAIGAYGFTSYLGITPVWKKGAPSKS